MSNKKSESWASSFYKLINHLDSNASGIAWWSEDGSKIIINNTKRFTDSYGILMPKVKNPQYASIVKQLNNYGFQKANPGQMNQYIIFGHELFHRDDSSRLGEIEKKEKKESTEKRVEKLEDQVYVLNQKYVKMQEFIGQEAKDSSVSCMSMSSLPSEDEKKLNGELLNGGWSRSSQVVREKIIYTSTSGESVLTSVMKRLTSLEQKYQKMEKENETMKKENETMKKEIKELKMSFSLGSMKISGNDWD